VNRAVTSVAVMMTFVRRESKGSRVRNALFFQKEKRIRKRNFKKKARNSRQGRFFFFIYSEKGSISCKKSLNLG